MWIFTRVQIILKFIEIRATRSLSSLIHIWLLVLLESNWPPTSTTCPEMSGTSTEELSHYQTDKLLYLHCGKTGNMFSKRGPFPCESVYRNVLYLNLLTWHVQKSLNFICVHLYGFIYCYLVKIGTKINRPAEKRNIDEWISSFWQVCVCFCLSFKQNNQWKFVLFFRTTFQKYHKHICVCTCVYFSFWVISHQ